MSTVLYSHAYTPAMPLPFAQICGDAHFGWSFAPQITLENTLITRIICSNNTPQAYLSEHRRDAQTGGLLISGVGYAI